MIDISVTYLSKLSGKHSKKDSIIAMPALLTSPSKVPKESTSSLVLFQSSRSIHATSIEGYSFLSFSKFTG